LIADLIASELPVTTTMDGPVLRIGRPADPPSG
jgi:hypothetical protein